MRVLGTFVHGVTPVTCGNSRHVTIPLFMSYLFIPYRVSQKSNPTVFLYYFSTIPMNFEAVLFATVPSTLIHIAYYVVSFMKVEFVDFDVSDSAGLSLTLCAL